MPVGRYKHVASRFKQSRVLPADCKSWIERPNDEIDAASSQSASAPASAAAAVSGSGRLGGDLPENVTEERLYKSRLYDLARERQKMIQESDYVRNQFIDHQVRKARSKSLGRLLQGMDIEQYRNKSASGVEKLHQRSLHAKLMILAAKKLGLSIDEISKYSEAELRQRLNLPTSGGIQEAVDEAVETARSPPPLILPQQQQHHHHQRPSTSRTQLSGFWPDASASRPNSHRPQSRLMDSGASVFALPRLASTADRRDRRQSSHRARGSVAFAAGGGNAQSTTTPERRPRTASARRRVQTDPRCVQLINSLTPRYKTASKTDVAAIIRSNPSLCQSGGDNDRTEQRQKVSKGRRTRREALEMLDGFARTRYYDAGNLATLG